MKILAVETACLTASCAVVEEGRVLAELTCQQAMTHSQKLIPMIEALLTLLDIQTQEIDLFAASIGPGSFTGLRIGIVTVKGMAYALKKPVCGIPTLDALAYSTHDFNGIVCPMLDARNNQVYTALYRKQGEDFDRLTEYMGVQIDVLSSLLAKQNEQIMILGDAAARYYCGLQDSCVHRITMADSALFTPRASCTALLAEKQAKKGVLSNCLELEPLYLRKSQAERMKDLPNS